MATFSVAFLYMEKIKEIIQKINNAGYEAYLVGGSSRDFFLNLPFSDIDIASNCPIDVLETLFDIKDEMGKSLGSIKIDYKGMIAEITTFREEYYKNDTIYPHIKCFIKDKENDAKRRDFTINAIYYNPLNEYIFDPYNGLDDLKNKTLRFIGDPLTRIKEDPTRIFRAIRIAKKLNFKIASNDKKIILENMRELERINKIKYNKEVERLYQDLGKTKAIEVLKEYKII